MLRRLGGIFRHGECSADICAHHWRDLGYWGRSKGFKRFLTRIEKFRSKDESWCSSRNLDGRNRLFFCRGDPREAGPDKAQSLIYLPLFHKLRCFTLEIIYSVGIIGSFRIIDCYVKGYTYVDALNMELLARTPKSANYAEPFAATGLPCSAATSFRSLRISFAAPGSLLDAAAVASGAGLRLAFSFSRAPGPLGRFGRWGL